MTAYLIAARRTAVMPRGGAFAALSLQAMAAPVIAACLADAGVDAAQVEELVLSNALGAGGNPARLVALAAGLPETVAGLSLDRQCAGGLDALLLARALILAGQAEVVLAGGVESYSLRPVRLRPVPGGDPVAYDAPPFTPWPDRDPPMADAAAALAVDLGISRAEQDGWAVASHARARAGQPGMLAEIVALPEGAQDGFVRALTPAVAARARVLAGTVTVANAAVAADGAAFCLVVSERIARRATRALRISGVTLGGRPEVPGLAPVAAIRRAFAAEGLRPGDLAAAEVMEAYAVQAIACVRGAGLDPARVNPGGGALARGHPVGASGAVLAVRLFAGLAQGGAGVAAIAAAGGIGTALVLRS